MHALNIDNVHKNFGAVEVLKGINLDLEEGGFLVLLGPSGCGKSTLLSLIAGLEDISAGSIRIGGNVANGVYPKDRDIAMVFQSYALYPSMTVDGNLGFGLKMRGVDKPTRETAVSQAAKLLNIGQLLRRKPGALSGGQRQRVAMGRAIVRDPKLFLFDEPLSNLDAKLRAKMRGEIKKLHQRLNASIVYVTHDQVEAMTLATKVAILNAGEVMQVGTPDEIYGDPDNLFVAGFVGSPPMNMLQAEVDETGRAVRITDTEKTLPLPTSLGTLARGRKVVLGIRPEWLTTRAKQNVASPIGLTAPLEVLEPMGADTLALLTIGNDEVTARLGGRERPEVGKPIQLFANAEDLLVFDAESTRRVRAPST